MDIYLIRHADAVPRGTPGFDDESRPLTEQGQEQARQLGEMFRERKLHLDSVISSPLVRASQTTQALLTDWPDPRPLVLTFEEIGGDMRPKRVAKYLEKLGHLAVAVVGHQPTIGQFAGWLIGSKKAQVDLEKAGVACIACDAVEKRGGVLRWLITPEWF